MENLMLVNRPTADEVALDAAVMAELTRLHRVSPTIKVIPLALPLPTPNAVDLSPHLRYIRCQGGSGCWGFRCSLSTS